MPGIPWDVQILYDPPGSDRLYTTPSEGRHLEFAFQGQASHQPAAFLVDTGCSMGPYVSAAFCRRIGLSYRPNPVSQPVDPTEFTDGQSSTLVMPPVQLPNGILVPQWVRERQRSANGQTLSPLGVVKLPVRIQGYKETLMCTVLDIDPGVDVILGCTWLDSHRAILDFAQSTLSFQVKGSLVTLRPRVTPARSARPASPPRLLQLGAVHWAARKSAPMFLVYLRQRPPGTASSEGEAPGSQPSDTESKDE